MLTLSAPCRDELGLVAWAFDPRAAAWRPCVLIGPSEVANGRLLTPVRFCEGRVLRVGPSGFSRERPSETWGARILEE